MRISDWSSDVCSSDLPWVKSSLAPGSKAVQLYLEDAKLLPELEQLGFGIVGFACTTCNGMSGALDPVIQKEVVDRDLYATAVLSGNRNFDGRKIGRASCRARVCQDV